MSIPWADEEGEIDRLMCWAHVYRAVDRPEYLAAVRAEHKEVANKIMDDLNTFQWTANDEMTFRRVFKLLEKKHISTDNAAVETRIARLLQYIRDIWVNSKEFRYEHFFQMRS